MKVIVYARIAVDEIEISEKDFEAISKSFLNPIPDRVFDQIEDALGANALLVGIERIDTTEGDTIQEY